MSEPRTEVVCRHEQVASLGLQVWACEDCRLRFYPACRTCVDVGHRNVVHPEAEPETGLDVERLTVALTAAYTYEEDESPTLRFYDDIEVFWEPFAAVVAREYAALDAKP